MQQNPPLIAHPAPQKNGQNEAFQVISSAPLEKNKKRLRLPIQDNNSNIIANSISSNNSNNSNTSSNASNPNMLNNPMINTHSYQQYDKNQQPIVYQQPQFIQGQPFIQPYFQGQPIQIPLIPQQQQAYPFQYPNQGLDNQFNRGNIPYTNSQFPHNNQFKKQGYNQKTNTHTNIITTNNSQTPVNTPQTIREPTQQFFGQQPQIPIIQNDINIMDQLSSLSHQILPNTQQQQPNSIPKSVFPPTNNFNQYQKNDNIPFNSYEQQQHYMKQTNPMNRGYKEDVQNIPNRKQYNNNNKQNEVYFDEMKMAEEQRQKELQLKKNQEEQEEIRRREEEGRQRKQEELERKLQEEEEERKRVEEERKRIEEEEEEKKRKEEEEKRRLEEEQKRIEEEKLEQERQLILQQERKRPTFEKIQYFITGIISQTIKITYDDGTDEEFKKSIEKFEERKLTEASDDKKAPLKSAYNGGVSKKTERSSNIQVPNQSSQGGSGYNRSQNVNTFPTNNSNLITRQAPDPDEIRIMESAKRGWLVQQSQVDEHTQKLKDIKRLTNILTFDNLEKLKIDFLKYAQDSTTCIDVIAAIMEKAITEIKYTALYGQLCKFLNDEIKKTSKENQFKNSFISQIQEKFDDIAQVLKVKANKPLTSMTLEERTDFHSQRKKRIILLVKFIGELFILTVISKHVIKIVIAELMTKYFKYKDVQKLDEANDNYIHYDDCLQGIIELYEITGPILDSQKKDSKIEAKCIDDIKKQIIETKTISEQWYYSLENIGFQDMISILEVYKNHGDVSHRIKALLQNLIERRNKNWEERLFQKEKPKTLWEIKQEHERDLQQRAEEVENFSKNGGKNQFNSYKNYSSQPMANQMAGKRVVGRGYTNQTKKEEEVDEIDEDEKESQKKNSDKTFADLFGSSHQPQQAAAKAPKVQAQAIIDYESKIKEIYQKIDKQEEVEQCLGELQTLCKKDRKKVLVFMISMCYTEKKEQNEIRTQYLISLIKQNLFTPQEICDMLNSMFATAQKEACDYPDVYKCLAQIIEFLMVNTQQFNLSAIKIELTGDEDDDFDILYFFEELFNELVKPFKERGIDLKSIKESFTKIYQNAKLDEGQVNDQVSKFF